MKLTVTIARQLGSGGSEVGQSIADALGIRCIDREIISRTAQRLELHEQEVTNREERVSSFWERMLTGFIIGAPEAAYIAPPFQTASDRDIFDDETEVMKAIVQKEDCVIVGRAAAHVLPPHSKMVNILLHAPLSFRIPRVMEFYGARNEAQARAQIEQSDAARGKLIAQMTGHNWSAAANYHMCVDSSALPLSEITDLAVDFIQRKLRRES